MSRAPSPMTHMTPSASSSSTITPSSFTTPQAGHSIVPDSFTSSSSHLSPYASHPNHASPSHGQANHPSIPPRSALRVNTDFGRLRSNSSALPGARPSPRPVDPPAPFGGPAQHQFSRSMSHASPLSPEINGGRLVSPVNGMREGRDVFMAVRNLRGVEENTLESPTSPMRYMANGSSSHPYPRPSHSTTDLNGQYPDTQPVENMQDEEEEDESDTLEKIYIALNKSNDEGNTLDLSRRGIQQIGPAAVEVFRKGVGQDGKGVWRLALSYNALRDNGIDFSFSRLGRLRYLNLKGNNFTTFPLALTAMPALEILDLSKNRLTTFPDQPGRLSLLKVLSLTNNKIYTLPIYLTKFEALKVFKVDNNPIEWPPKEVLGALVDGEFAARDREEGGNRDKKREEDLRPWIENMKSWMRQKAAETDRLLERSRENEGVSRSSDGPPTASTTTTNTTSDSSQNSQVSPTTRMNSQQTIRPIREETPGRSASPVSIARMVRPSTGTRSRSATLLNDETSTLSSSPSKPALQLETSHARQSSVTSPPPSAISQASSSHSRILSADLPPPPPIPAIAGHNRGASYTATQRLSATLASKKSLPDLRQSHAKIIQDRRESGQQGDEIRPLGLGIKTPPSSRFNPSTSPWSAEMSKSPSSASFRTEREHNRTLGRKGSADMLRRSKGTMGPDMLLAKKRDNQDRPLVDDSRNSYFRRLSTLPVSSISKAIPSSLLRCVDAIRGILFALSQLHSALRQYLLFAVSDRVSSLFSKVMDPAGSHMTALINALDRFDSMSRRGTPPVTAIRGVLEATRDSVVTFAKVVAVLKLQMPALNATDVRYTRTLLLMIYGSMAEVSYSWTAIAPLISDIRLVLANGQQGRPVLGGTKMVASASFLGRTPISPIPERGESHSPPSVARSERTEKALGTSPLHQSVSAPNASQESPTAAATTSRAPGVAAKSRRQAGSFSTQDVERGMKMGGSPGGPETGLGDWRRHQSSGSSQSLLARMEESDAEDEARMLSALDDEELDSMLPNPPFALKAGVSNSSAGTLNLPQTPPDHPAALQPIAMIPTSSQNSRRGFHNPSSSSGSSHLVQSYGVPRKLSVDIRPPTAASAGIVTQFDEDLLDVIESATDVAFTAWLRLAEDIGASSPPSESGNQVNGHSKSSSQSSLSSGPYTPIDSRRPNTISTKHYAELLNLLSSSESTTSTLRETLMAIRANPSSSSTTLLHAHAQAFVKAVVKVTELVMKISATHNFPSGVKSCCAKLVTFTREFAILFSVSNMRPGTSASTRSGITMGQGSRSTSPMPFSSRSTPRSASGSGFNRSISTGAESSNEDLLHPNPPHSAISTINSSSGGSWSSSTASPISAGYQTAVMNGAPASAGLRGLQLPSRQAALAKRRAGNVGR